MTPLRCRSFAKVNLHLQVVGRRADGYHELRTLFQTVELHDLVSVELAGSADSPDSPGSNVVLTVDGADLAPDASNLAARAAAAFLAQLPARSRRSHPPRETHPDRRRSGRRQQQRGHGLAGIAGAHGRAGTRQRSVADRARSGRGRAVLLGAGARRSGVGRGDEVIALPELAEEELVLALPPVAVSTAEIFAALPELPPAPLAPDVLALAAGGRRAVAPAIDSLNLWNDLQATVVARVPEVASVYTALLRSGALWVRLSGSGGTWCARWPAERGVVEDAEHVGLPPGTGLVRTRMLTRDSVARRRIVEV